MGGGQGGVSGRGTVLRHNFCEQPLIFDYISSKKSCIGFGFFDKNGIMKIGKVIVVGFLKLSVGSVL